MHDSTEVPLHYAGTRGLTGIAIRNFALSVVTLGFYRFWARTNLRRYFWRQVTIGDEPLEYTGTGKELFIGFLIVVAILAPIGLIYAVAQQMLLSNPVAAAATQAAAFMALGFLSIIAVFRARRYRLSRTVWRGIHAGQDGSALRYLFLSVAWSVFAFVTAGLGNPWRNNALQRYLIRSTRFGTTNLSYDGAGRTMFGRWLVTWIAIGAAMLSFVIATGGAAFLLTGNTLALDPEQRARAMAVAGLVANPVIAAALVALVILGPVAWVWYRVSEFRFFARVTGLGEARFSSLARARRVGPIYLVYYLLLIVVPAVAAAGVAAAFYFVPALQLARQQLAAAVPGILLIQATTMAVFVLFIAVSGLVRILWLQPRLLRHLCTTMTIANPQALTAVAQSSAARQRYGEGLADSFDVDAI